MANPKKAQASAPAKAEAVNVDAITDSQMIAFFSNKAGKSEGTAAFCRFCDSVKIDHKSDDAKSKLRPRWEKLAAPFRAERTASVAARIADGLMHCAYMNHAESLGIMTLTEKGRSAREALITAKKAAKAAAKKS